MPNPNLDDLLKQWSDAEAANDPATDCPPISVLWSHETEPRPSGSVSSSSTSNPQPSTFDLRPSTPLDTAHIAACPRCQKRLAIIRTELANATAPLSTFPFPTRIRRTAAALALAASIALVFIIWPSPDTRQFDAQVAAYAYSMYAGHGDMRGDATPSSQPSDGASDSIADALSIVGSIGQELTSGRLVLDADAQPVLAPNIDVATERGRKLADLVADDRAATERIVDALLQAIPEASEKDRTALRRSLNRWRAKELFGIQE